MSEHTAERDTPRITAVVVHVTCDRCALDDEFEFTPEDIKAGAEISTPCACDRRLAVTADASAQYARVAPPGPPRPPDMFLACDCATWGEATCPRHGEQGRPPTPPEPTP